MTVSLKKDFLRPAVCFGFALLVLVYLTIRAFYTEFLSDETATYWYFILRGAYWGDNVVWDAANHPLNSFLGHHLFLRVGDVPGILRIGTLFSYILYVIGTYRLTGLFQKKSLQILGFIALNGIPYMLEYFAYSRGYGLSMGFFMLSVWMFVRYAQSLRIIFLVATYLLGFLAFAANLTLLNSLLLVIGGVGFIHLLNWKKISWLQHGIAFVGALFLARISWPLIAFGLKLKESGALYYSSLDGVWDMTGKSISRYVIFTDNDLLMYVFLLLFLVFLFQLYRLYRSKGLRRFFEQPQTWIGVLFFGNLVAVVLMAFLLKVNYPEDRTGMYFIPLFLLLLFYALEKVRYLEYSLLFFPLSLVTHLSLHSSVFTPEERLTTSFYREVKSKLKPEDVVSIYHTQFANWQYQESHQNSGIHFPHISMRQGNEADVFITRKGVEAIDSLRNPYLDQYELIAEAADNDHIAYRRKTPRKELQFFHLDSAYISGKGEFMELLNRPDFFKNEEDVRFRFRFHLLIDRIDQSTDFVLVTTDKDGNMIRYEQMALELNYQSKKVDNWLQFSVMVDNLTPKEKGVKVYLWSRKEGVFHEVKTLSIDAFSSGN